MNISFICNLFDCMNTKIRLTGKMLVIIIILLTALLISSNKFFSNYHAYRLIKPGSHFFCVYSKLTSSAVIVYISRQQTIMEMAYCMRWCSSHTFLNFNTPAISTDQLNTFELIRHISGFTRCTYAHVDLRHMNSYFNHLTISHCDSGDAWTHYRKRTYNECCVIIWGRMYPSNKYTNFLFWTLWRIIDINFVHMSVWILGTLNN